jgi:hypothetical protein
VDHPKQGKKKAVSFCRDGDEAHGWIDHTEVYKPL